MKVMVGINDFNEACIKDKDFNGYVIVEAEPIECQHEWICDQLLSYPPQNGPYYCRKCRIAKPIEEEVEWERGLKCTLEGDGKISDGCEDCIEHIKSFIRNLLKELVTELFHSPTTAEAWKRIYKKYGIED